LVSVERYQEAVHDTRLFLSGRHADLARDLKQRRDAAAEAERYEEAASWRDLLTVLEEVQARQKMHAVSGADADIIGYHREDERVALNLFHLRHGRVVDRREFFRESLPEADEGGRGDSEILGALLKQIYLQQPYLPPQISVPLEFDDRETLAAALSAQRGTAVEIAIPQRGAKKEMLELAMKNARHSFARRFRSLPANEQANADWRALAHALQLDMGEEAGRIECFDISHFQGAETVASMVVWDRDRMDHGQYRKFRMRTVAGVDDFRSIEEVVRRRYRRRLDEGAELPGLILIDGGLGQLHAAQRALEELGLGHLPLASLAKREELIYVAGHEDAPVRLGRDARPLQILQSIRDEAHRFAITFHRQRRGKAALPGLNPKPRRRRRRASAPRSEQVEAMPGGGRA
jgi:excinuclease ABC subunit C